ncbi:MAG: hypothetical protein J6A09_03390 [Alphaproteobacteria bacterium]|nr:hypothetical protein [Alphaproteobacteria bacterium]
MFYTLLLSLLMALCPPVAANPLSLQSLYTNPENKTLPEVIIFHNSANPCENCEKAINMLISVLRKNYSGKIRAYLLDEERHPEFISAFQLKAPLTLVVIRISDGASFGYAKLEGLQSDIYDKQQFSKKITQFIDNFLASELKN